MVRLKISRKGNEAYETATGDRFDAPVASTKIYEEPKPKRKISRKTKKRIEAAQGIAFAAPLVIGLSLFLAFPLLYAVYLSFTDYTFATADSYNFVGLENYITAFNDGWFTRSLVNALINCIGVPIGLFLALVFSCFLTKIKKGSTVFRSILYIPTVCGAVAITFIWSWMYQPMYGLIGRLCQALGLGTVSFLGEELFFPSMITMGVWSGLGTSILLIYASLKNVPKALYEAAEIDGANAVQQFIHVTLPAISPITFYILLTGISGSFQDFTRFQVMRGDAMTEWSVMPVWYIYKYTTSSWNYAAGYACALGIVLGLIILAISAVQFVLSRFWVHYDE